MHVNSEKRDKIRWWKTRLRFKMPTHRGRSHDGQSDSNCTDSISAWELLTTYIGTSQSEIGKLSRSEIDIFSQLRQLSQSCSDCYLLWDVSLYIQFLLEGTLKIEYWVTFSFLHKNTVECFVTWNKICVYIILN